MNTAPRCIDGEKAFDSHVAALSEEISRMHDAHDRWVAAWVRREERKIEYEQFKRDMIAGKIPYGISEFMDYLKG